MLDSETSHVTDMSMTLVTDSLGVRLKTPTAFTIPPYNIAMIPLESPFRALHCTNGSSNLFEVIGNPLLIIEQLYLLILHTLHTLDI